MAADPDEAGFYFPVWTLLDVEEVQRSGLRFPAGVPQVIVPDIGKSLMLFTDDDLAKRFIEDLRKPNRRPAPVHHPKHLINLCEHYQREGTVNVGLDISFFPNSEGGFKQHGGKYCRIGDFIEMVRASWLDQGNSPQG